MGIYAELVRAALEAYAPQVEVGTFQLRDTSKPRVTHTATRGWAFLNGIVQARRRSVAVEADVCHVLDASFGYMLGNIPWGRTLVTVHDMIPSLQASGRFPIAKPHWAARQLIASSLRKIRKAGAVCAVSQASAKDVAAFTGRRVEAVIPNYLRQFPFEGDLPKPYDDLDRPFLLHVGNNGFYKNRPGIVRVFAQLARERPELGLVLAGAAPNETLLVGIRGLGLAARVRFNIDPDDTRMAALYRRAALLLFPSLYEGFGWPPLEAMHFDCPVVCSDAGSLPEVTGDAALRCAPDDIAGLAAAAARILDDRDLRRDLVMRGRRNLERFTAQRMAAGLVMLYERLADGEKWE